MAHVRQGLHYKGPKMAGRPKQSSTGATIELPECPVCMENMTAPIFQCQSGHSLCNVCTRNLIPPLCPICRQQMTQIRNWQLEDLISKAKVPCQNKGVGCVYEVKASEMENHLKDCIFRDMECPLGVFGKCSWKGKLNEMLEHFKQRHQSNCNVSTDTDVTISNINTREDDRYMFLIPQAKLLFILTFRIDTIEKMAFWTIQHIGTKTVAHQHIYEIHVTSRLDNRRKVVFTEHCYNDGLKAEEICRQGKCAVIPLDVLNNFIKDKQLTFRFFIKRNPPKNKNEGPSDGPSNNGPGGPKPHGPKGPGKGPKGDFTKKFNKP